MPRIHIRIYVHVRVHVRAHVHAQVFFITIKFMFMLHEHEYKH
jgi:hypothetical protein